MSLFSQYLRTDHYKQLVSLAAASNPVCCKCGATENLTARHKTYERLGREHVGDFETICKLCIDIWPQKPPNNSGVRAVDPQGWVDYAVLQLTLQSDRWKYGPECEQEAFEAWLEHRTLKAAMRAANTCRRRYERRKYADPETPIQLPKLT